MWADLCLSHIITGENSPLLNIFVNLFILCKSCILTRVVVYPEPIPGTLDMRQKHPGWDTSPLRGTIQTHIHTKRKLRLAIPATGMISEGGKKLENVEDVDTGRTYSTQTVTDSYLSSRLNQGHWSSEVAQLPAVPTCCTKHIQWFKNNCKCGGWWTWHETSILGRMMWDANSVPSWLSIWYSPDIFSKLSTFLEKRVKCRLLEGSLGLFPLFFQI